MVPIILLDIYCVLIILHKRKDFLEGCNIFIQMWIVEHYYPYPMVGRFVPGQFDHIIDYEKRMKGYKRLKVFSDWDKFIPSIVVDNITWNLPWLPYKKVIQRSIIHHFLFFMGIRCVQ